MFLLVGIFLESMFLMHRVELKVNHKRIGRVRVFLFLMHRVELKVKNSAPVGVLDFTEGFLMHRVELKVLSQKKAHPEGRAGKKVPNAPCGVESFVFLQKGGRASARS